MTRRTIGEILSLYGLEETDDSEPILMTLDSKGSRFWTVGEAGQWFPEQADALYHASGLFKKDSVSRKSGKSQENLTDVVWLPWDIDLLDYLGADAKGEGRKAAAEQLYAMPQDEIDALIWQMRQEAEAIFKRSEIPIHRLDQTGYGLCAYTYIHPDDRGRIQDARTVHKRGIEIANQLHGGKLIDPQTSDAGTRVTRVPGSFNKKNPQVPRLVKNLISWNGTVVRLPEFPDRPVRIPAPIQFNGRGLSPEDASWIVDSLRPFHTLGQKHSLSLALAGYLGRAGVPEDQTESIIERLSADDDRPGDRLKAVRSTYERLRNGSETAGHSVIKDLVPDTVLMGLETIRAKYTASKGATLDYSSIEIATQTERASDPPKNAKLGHSELTPPAECLSGWLREYVDLMEPLSEAPISYHLACGLTLAGATFGRSVSVRYIAKSIHANLFTMLVGLAGTSRKDTAIRLSLELPFIENPNAQRNGVGVSVAPFTIATDVGSAEGLIKLLSERPNTLLYITEYQRLSQNAHRQATGTILNVLTAAWDTPFTLQNITKGNPLEARFPYLSVMAAVQPGILSSEMLQSDIESGYATRWLFVPGQGSAPKPEPPDIDAEAASELYRRLITNRTAYERMGTANMRLDEVAKKRWIEWYGFDRERPINSEDEDSMRSRLAVHIRKVALIYAACEGSTEINISHLDPAIAFVEWVWGHTKSLMKDWGTGIFQRLENRIEAVLIQHGPINRRGLVRMCSSRLWTSRDFNIALESMVKNESVLILPDGRLTINRETVA